MSSNRVDAKSFRPPRSWRFIVLAVLGVVVACLDQLTKVLVRSAQAAGAFPQEIIPGVIGLEYVENRGAAFRLGEGYGFVFVLLAAFMVVGSIVYLVRAPLTSRLEAIGLGMVCGGAVGNAIDRMAWGFVTDFLTFRFFDFPSFNVADMGITVGIVIALIGFLFLSPANEVARERAREERAAYDARAQHPRAKTRSRTRK